MTCPVINPNMQITPAKNIVVNPPDKMYRFSLYNELQLSNNLSKSFINSVSRPSEGVKNLKRKNKMKNLATAAVVVGGGFILYLKRGAVLNLAQRCFEAIKKLPFLKGKI